MKKEKINIAEIEKHIGYVFTDKSLLTQAFTRTSFCNEQAANETVRYQSNEVLEFFGDGVLSLAIISFMLNECTERYKYGIRTELNEGDFSNLKSKLSDKQNLSKSMSTLGLQKYLRMGEGDAKLGVQDEPSVMEDLFESIVGAIYIDSGMKMSAVITSVSRMLDMSVYTSKEKPVQSSKNALQEWCADKKRRLPAPRYETLSEDGPDHKKTYVRGCYIGDRLAGRGVGKNFKLADAAAADDAIKTLMAEESKNLTTKIDISASNTPTSAKQAKKETSKSVAKKEQKSQSPAAAIFKETAPRSEANKNAGDTVSPAAKIKAYVSSSKLPTPMYKDLGETKIGQDKMYRVECILSGDSVIGVGKTRSEARENSSLMMIEKLGIGRKKAAKAVEKTKSSGVAKKSKQDPLKKALKIEHAPVLSENTEKADKQKANKQSALAGKSHKGSGKSPHRNKHFSKRKTVKIT